MMPTQITVPDISGITNFMQGNKTYISLAVAAVVIAANHFGFLPPEYAPAGLNPSNWINDEFMLLLAATGRSALKKVEPPKPAG